MKNVITLNNIVGVPMMWHQKCHMSLITNAAVTSPCRRNVATFGDMSYVTATCRRHFQLISRASKVPQWDRPSSKLDNNLRELNHTRQSSRLVNKTTILMAWRWNGSAIKAGDNTLASAITKMERNNQIDSDDTIYEGRSKEDELNDGEHNQRR